MANLPSNLPIRQNRFLYYNPKNGGRKFLQTVGNHLQDKMVSQVVSTFLQTVGNHRQDKMVSQAVSKFLQTAGNHLQDKMVSQAVRPESE
jgi:hypothetical protein